MNSRPRFFVLSGPEVGRDFTCAAGDTLGRAASCSVSLQGNALSRTHARVERDGDGWVLEDAGSRNGMRQGGVRVPRVPLTDGAEFVLGDVNLRVRLEFVDEGNAVSLPSAGPSPPQEAQGSPPSPPVLPPDPEEIVLEGDWVSAAPATEATAPPPPPRQVEPVPASMPDARARAGMRPAAQSTGGKPVLQYSQMTDRRGFLGSDLAQHPLWVRLAVGLGVVVGTAGVFYLVFRLVTTLRGAP